MRVWMATKMRNWKPAQPEIEIFASKKKAARQLQKWAEEIVEDAHLLDALEGEQKTIAYERIAKSDWLWFAQNWQTELWIEPKTVRGAKK